MEVMVKLSVLLMQSSTAFSSCLCQDCGRSFSPFSMGMPTTLLSLAASEGCSRCRWAHSRSASSRADKVISSARMMSWIPLGWLSFIRTSPKSFAESMNPVSELASGVKRQCGCIAVFQKIGSVTTTIFRPLADASPSPNCLHHSHRTEHENIRCLNSDRSESRKCCLTETSEGWRSNSDSGKHGFTCHSIRCWEMLKVTNPDSFSASLTLLSFTLATIRSSQSLKGHRMNWKYDAQTDMALALSEVGKLDNALLLLHTDGCRIPLSLAKAKLIADKLAPVKREPLKSK